MKLTDDPEAIFESVRLQFPEVDEAIKSARWATQRGKGEIYPYQAACLYALATKYNRKDANILEIGTYYGFSACVMAQAAPLAHIVTLNPLEWEHKAALNNLRRWKNVRVKCIKSQDYLEGYEDPPLDMIFVDGDHKRIREDLPWWNELAPDGLMVFHDYTPQGSKRHCPPVWRGLRTFTERLGREPDVLIVDSDNVGMAGWYKMPDDCEVSYDY
jgi:predicted O-methyltransferase YrrM